MFHSGNEFPIREMKNDLGLTNFECTRDSHGNNFTYFETSAPKRANHILNVFQEFNRDYPSKAIQIDGGLGLDPPIVTFSIRENYKKHHVYRKIMSAKAAKQSGRDVSYTVWTPTIQEQLDRNEDHARYEADNNVQDAVMEDDPSAFNMGHSDQEENESDDNNNDQDEEISANHASVGARLAGDEVALQLPGIQTVGISSVGSNESFSIEMVRMDSAMNKLTGENAKLTGENAKLTGENAKLTGESAKSAGKNAKLSGENAKLAKENAKLTGESAKSTGENAKLSGENARLARKNAKLTVENNELKAQLRTRPSESTEELSYKLDTLISHAEKSSSLMEKSSSLMEKSSSGVEKLQKTSETLISHAEKTSAGVELIVSEQGFITDNTLDSSFLVSSLESTTQDRDGLRTTVRSQAGKMGSVTKKLKKIEKKISKLEAERGQTIERSEVIEEMRMMETRMNQDNRRAEKRWASHMEIQDQPLGNPSDNYPYSQWTNELRDEFSVKLKKNYEGAARLVKRNDLPPLEDFRDAAKSRLFQIGLGVVLSNPGNTRNLENSPSKHRYDLVKLSGSIFDVNTAAKIRTSLDIEEKYWCNKLSKPYVENRKVYPLMEGDAFLSPDVSAAVSFVFFVLIPIVVVTTEFLQMKHWKLEHRPRGFEFNKFKKLTGEVVQGHCYSDDVWWRYYTMLHMTGSPTRLIAEEHVANLDCIGGGRYYSKETVNAMETDYLTRIAELKTEVLSLALLHDDTEFKNAAQDVISCMHSKRQNSRSTRPGKINNQTGMRC